MITGSDRVFMILNHNSFNYKSMADTKLYQSVFRQDHLI